MDIMEKMENFFEKTNAAENNKKEMTSYDNTNIYN